MEKNLKEKNNSGIIIVILCVLLLASIGFICYDKFLKKEEPKPTDCNCSTCEKCNKEVNQDTKSEKCVLDMNGKTNLDVNSECANMEADNSNAIVKNIKLNGKNYELKYIFVKDESSSDSRLAYDNGVTIIYVNGKLLDAFPGQYRNVLMTIKTSGSKLILGETFPSDVPAAEHTYDLSEFD